MACFLVLQTKDHIVRVDGTFGGLIFFFKFTWCIYDVHVLEQSHQSRDKLCALPNQVQQLPLGHISYHSILDRAPFNRGGNPRQRGKGLGKRQVGNKRDENVPWVRSFAFPQPHTRSLTRGSAVEKPVESSAGRALLEEGSHWGHILGGLLAFLPCLYASGPATI